MKKHNIILAALACVAAVSLSACSKAKVPTVDELFAQPFGSAAVTSGDLDVKLTTSVTTQSGTTDVDLNVNSRFQDTVRYISGTEAGTTGGTAYNNKLESYLIADGGGVYQHYSLNSQTGRWEVSSSDGSDAIDTSSLLDLNKSVFSDLAVQDYKKGDSEYVVRGTISYADLKTLLGSMTNKVPSTTDLGVLPATLRFDTTSKQLNSFMVLIEAPVGDINKFEFSYKVNNLNSTTVTLPDDVKNNAVPAGTNSGTSFPSLNADLETNEDGTFKDVSQAKIVVPKLDENGNPLPIVDENGNSLVTDDMIMTQEEWLKSLDETKSSESGNPASEGLIQIGDVPFESKPATSEESESESSSEFDPSSESESSSESIPVESDDKDPVKPIQPNGKPGYVSSSDPNDFYNSVVATYPGLVDSLLTETIDGVTYYDGDILDHLMTIAKNGDSGRAAILKVWGTSPEDRKRAWGMACDWGITTRDFCIGNGADAQELDNFIGWAKSLR